MKRARGVRGAFVITVAGGALATGCADVKGGTPDAALDAAPDAAAEAAVDGGGAACPDSAPETGSACTLPSTRECVWGGMSCPPYQSGTFARCMAGRWEVQTSYCNPPPPDVAVVAPEDVADE